MREREVRAEIDGCFEFGHGLVLASAKPQRPAHSPMRRWVAITSAIRLCPATAKARSISGARAFQP